MASVAEAGSMMAAAAPWHEFYTLLGAASATMTGLLFVAASVGSGMFSRDRMASLRMFLSTSVVLFASTLAVSLIVLAPIRSAGLLSLMIVAVGCFGMGYYVIAWRALARDGRIGMLDWEDRIWYALMPAFGYLSATVAGFVVAMRVVAGLDILALALGLLLLAAIHNAWDITVWSVTRRPE